MKKILGIDKNDIARISRLEDDFFQALFTCLPIIGIPFICDNLINNFFEYNRYWCHRWCKNMGIDDAKKFLIPSGNIILSDKAKKTLKQITPVSKIVLFAPEAATVPEYSPDFWNIIAEEVHKKGYTIIVNSKKYKINYGISAFDLGLSLEDIVILGLSCAYVFSLRSGLCDVLVGARERLYTFYPAMLRREMWSLSKPFTEKTNVNEILIYQWKISPVIWEEIDLTQKLQKQIDTLRKNYLREKLKEKNYQVLVNTFSNEDLPSGRIKIAQPVDELFALSQQTEGIISMGSGLAAFLTAANVKMDLIYTQFIDPNKKYSAKMVQKIYSVYHLPDVSDKKIKEYNLDDWSEKQIAEKILSRY